MSDLNNSALLQLKDLLREALPSERFPNGLRTYDYMWQYKLSTSYYNKLKKLVPLVCGDNPRINFLRQDLFEGSTNGNGNFTLALVVVLLLSEWYKRESTRLDGGGGLEAIGLVNCDSKKIKKAANFRIGLFPEAETENEMRLAAMCQLGGFPILVMNSTDEFANAIFEIQNEKSILDDTIYNISHKLNAHNNTFRASLESGSCREYLEMLAQYLNAEGETNRNSSKLPFAVEDLENNQDFRTFIARINEGVQRLRADFISGTYNLWTTFGAKEISCDFSVNIGHRSEANIISNNALEQCGYRVPNNVNVISIVLHALDSQDKEIDEFRSCRRTYRRLGNGRHDFSCMGSPDLTVKINLAKTHKLVLDVEVNGNKYRLNKEFEIPSYFELYQTSNPYCWTSSKINGALKTLLVKDSVYSLPENILLVEEKKEDINGMDFNDNWSWFIQNEKINLVNMLTNESVEVKYTSPSKIIIEFLSERGNYDLKREMKISEDNTVNIVMGEDSLRLPFLYGPYNPTGPHGLNMKVCYLDENNNDGLVEAKRIKIEYKSYNDSSHYEEWTSKNSPAQGVYKMRYSVIGNQYLQPVVNTVFYCPSEKPVKRDLGNRRISFGLNGIYKQNAKDNEFDVLVNSYHTDSDKCLSSDTIPFVLKTDDYYILFEVYRAIYVEDLYRDGEAKVISTRNNPSQPDVAICMRQLYYKRVINQTGIHYTRNTDWYYLNYMLPPAQLCSFIPIVRQDNRVEFNLYVYRDNTAAEQEEEKKLIMVDTKKGILSLKVGRKYAEQYNYFQYLYENDEVRRLSCTVVEIPNSKKVLLEFSGFEPVDGVSFQSMKGCKPNRYYRPFYSFSDYGGVKLSFSVKNGHFDTNSRKQVVAYKIACEHQIYFNILPQFSSLRSNPWKVGEFLDSLLKDKKYELDREDAQNLARFAVEMSFDWLLMPRIIWTSLINNSGEYKEKCLQSIRLILEYSPLTMRHTGERNETMAYVKSIYLYNPRFLNSGLSTSSVFYLTKGKKKNLTRFIMELLACQNYEDWKEKVTHRNWHDIDFMNKPEILLRCLSEGKSLEVFGNVFRDYVIK